MKQITEYGVQIRQEFLEKCKQDGTYQRVFEQYEDGFCILEESIKTVADGVAWCLLNYDTDAINVVNEWINDEYSNIVWGDISLEQIKIELEKCIA